MGLTPRDTYHVRNYPTCPSCKAQLGAATQTDPGEPSGPEPGAVTVCGECATILQFAPDMSLTLMPPEDLAALQAQDPEFSAVVMETQRRTRLRRALGSRVGPVNLRCGRCPATAVILIAPNFDTVLGVLEGVGWTVHEDPATGRFSFICAACTSKAVH